MKKPPATRSSRDHGQGRATLYAKTLNGLEAVLAEEVTSALPAADVEIRKRNVVFTVPGPIPTPIRLLTCDRLGLFVREAHGEFVGPRGLAAVRAKLARTQFDRALDLLSGPDTPAPRTFAVAAEVASGCGFKFFDLRREATPAIAKRLGMAPAEAAADMVLAVECFPDTLRIGIELPVASWSRAPAARSRVPRSLVGALVLAGEPKPHVSVCDPDCGSGEVLAAYESVIDNARMIGLSFGGGGPRATLCGERVVEASPRRWPIAEGRLSRVVSALPRVQTAGEFAKLLDETSRCLAPGGLAVFATAAQDPFNSAIEAQPQLSPQREIKFRWERHAGRIVVLKWTKVVGGHRGRLTAGDRVRATSELGDAKSERRGTGRRRPVRSRRTSGRTSRRTKRGGKK